MKRGIYDSKEKSTFDLITNFCLRLAILHLSMRYWMYLLSSRLRWIKMKCFTDNLFTGVKTLIGNTRSKLFTDGEYI